MNNTDIIHIYGVIEWSEESGQRFSQRVGIDGTSVLAIPCRRVAALASLLPAVEFGEEALKHKLCNPEATGLFPVLCAHAGVLASFVSEEEMDGSVRALVPLRFGTIFLTVENVVKWLIKCHDSLLSLLSRVRNKREWDIKQFVDSWALQKRIEPSITAEAEPNAAGGRGARYLLTRSHQMHVSRKASALVVESAQELHTALRKRAAGHCVLTFQSPSLDETALMDKLLYDADNQNSESRALGTDPDRSGDAPSLLFHGVYLVERHLEEMFLREITSFQEDTSAWGMLLHCSGPFPAYHFSELRQCA